MGLAYQKRATSQPSACPSGSAASDAECARGVWQVLRIQPDEAMYLKTNMKRPGETGVITAELDLSYNRAPHTTLSHSHTRRIALLFCDRTRQPCAAVPHLICSPNRHPFREACPLTVWCLVCAGRFPDAYVMEAYEKLIHDCMQGEHANFVRNDELRESWKVRSPHASPHAALQQGQKTRLDLLCCCCCGQGADDSPLLCCSCLAFWPFGLLPFGLLADPQPPADPFPAESAF
eukprot:COSAG04_NODE_48_length_31217_cov_204.046758_16_plen_234_part_00